MEIAETGQATDDANEVAGVENLGTGPGVGDLDEVARPLGEPDLLLSTLVGIVNQTPDATLGVTLFVHGAVVSGQIVGGAEFFEGLAEECDAAVRRDTGEEAGPDTLAGYFRDCGRRWYGDEADLDAMAITYIHLRDARVIQSNLSQVPTPGTWWRGRLTSVDGWIFGSLSSPSPQ